MKREREIEITPENIDSIIQESSQTVEEEPDLRDGLNQTKLSDNTPDLIEGPWHIPFRAAIYQERDDDRPLTPPSLRHDDPETIPQTPPKEQNNKKTHSPITFNTSPRRPVKERLGERPHTVANRRQDYHQDETPRRPVKDRLGVRRSKRKCRPLEPSGQEFAPQREVWNQDQDGYWYPVQHKDTNELGNVESSDQEEK